MLAKGNTMDIGVEISLYPLQAQFTGPIHDFIARLNADSRVKVISNSLSTQVFGRYETVFEALQAGMRATFEQAGVQADKAVFVMKVIGPLPSP
jgi:uncharacterized protein YqgV (UPF0045/DUF77 family)